LRRKTWTRRTAACLRVPAGILTKRSRDCRERLSWLSAFAARVGTRFRGWPHDVEGFKTWPAPGQIATVTLTGAQWNLVVFALRYWADVDESMSDAKGAAESR